MPKRGENIHKRSDGRWEGRYKIGSDAAGRTKYRSIYGQTYRETKEKLKTISYRSDLSSSHKNKDYKFRDIIYLWLESNKIKHKGATESKYEHLIEKHILPELGNMKASRITNIVLNDFMNRKLENGRLNNKGGLSPAYVRKMMIIITSALQYAANEQICAPLKTPVHKPSVEKKELSILSVSDQQVFEKKLMSNPDRTKLGVLISLNTGLRIGEICALSWDDLDLDNRIIHVRSTITRVKNTNDSSLKTMLIVDKPKTRSSMRDIPIPSKLLPVILEIKRQAITKYVVSDGADFISPRTFEYRYHRLLDKCNMKAINYHALRHTFATRCIEVGVDVKTLSEILGHANVSITLNTYVHPSMDLKRTQIEKLSLLSV